MLPLDVFFFYFLFGFHRIITASVVYSLGVDALRVRADIGFLAIRIMCSGGTTCLSADCCLSELALYKIQLSVLV